MADLYIALLDMSNRYCSLCFPETAPNPSRVSGTSLAKYLFTHPDRCRETLEALGNPDKTHPLLQALCRFNGQPTPGR